MNKKIFLIIFVLIFSGCTTKEIYNMGKAVVTLSPTDAVKTIIHSKAVGYVTSPSTLKRDLESLQSFIESITQAWGEKNAKVPRKKEYVKYLQDYKSRALIDFDKGVVTVETLDVKSAKKSLESAIVVALLLPSDPQAADLFNQGKVKLGGTPYLLAEVKDDQGKNIRYQWRANRFAKVLVKQHLKTRYIKNGNKKLKVTYVNIPMVKDHASVRVAKFKPMVKKFAKRYGVSENLIYAIIRTESNFNQFAVSHAGAIGLMQIVPTTAGRDGYKYIKGKSWTPSKKYLFNAYNNIELGSAYLKILNKNYLKGIHNPVSREYCVISAYNTGSGNVLRTFHSNRSMAKRIINESSPAEVYTKLRTQLPFEETRRYLKKVVTFKKQFVRL